MSDAPSQDLTRSEFDWLEHAEWGMRYFDGVFSGRNHRRAVAEHLTAQGLLRSVGLLHQTDDDDSVRWNAAMREAWVLTEKGRMALFEAREWFKRHHQRGGC